MTSISTTQIKDAFASLGTYLRASDDAHLQQLIHAAQYHNAWFTPEQTERAVQALGAMLNEQDLTIWLNAETETPRVHSSPKIIGLVLAGNIPMVGFHDILSVLASGHTALIKLSSQDKQLSPYTLNKLVEIEPAFTNRILYTERLQDFDAVIATGSNNTSRYFEHYFQHVPHIIRKNRNSVAVLSGQETEEELRSLGHDVLDYFGLGCRNVSKLYVPEGYSFNDFFRAIEPFSNIINHHKYNNNYDYNKSVYLVNKEPHFDNGFLLVRRASAADSLSSPLATLYYEEYQSVAALQAHLGERAEAIQCIVGSPHLETEIPLVPFGNSQKPKLWDYADGIDTLRFLLTL